MAAPLTCPRCGAALDAAALERSSAWRDPDVRAAVIERRLHRLTCACGANIDGSHAFVYSDARAGIWILVAAPGELARWSELERGFARRIDSALELGSPHLDRPRPARLRRRVVFGYEELREKLVLWDAGCDDSVVECAKLVLLASRPDLAAPGSRLLVAELGAADVELAWFADLGAGPVRGFRAPRGWLDAAEADTMALTARYAELFSEPFVSTLRYLL